MKQISAALIDCIRLSGAGATGALIHESNIAWQDIIKTASIQNVLSLVSCALLNNPELACPGLIKERLLDLMRSASATNAIRRQRMLHLIHRCPNDYTTYALKIAVAMVDMPYRNAKVCMWTMKMNLQGIFLIQQALERWLSHSDKSTKTIKLLKNGRA